MAAMKGPQMDLVDWQNDDAETTSPIPDVTYPGPIFRDTRRAQLETLAKAIEVEVIPRLLQARRAAAPPKARAQWQPTQADIAGFVALTLDRNDSLALARFQTLADSGIPLERLYALLLTPAALMLGAMWDEDRVNFTAVTTGVWRMQQILHAMSPAFVGIAPLHGPGPRVLFVPGLGSQHSMGLSMVSEYFRRAGWDVVSERFASEAELGRLVQESWFDMIGFSIGSDDQLGPLAASIRAARRASRNLKLGVMVGGPVFVAHPELVSQVGADATAADAAQATIEAEGLMTLLARTG